MAQTTIYKPLWPPAQVPDRKAVATGPRTSTRANRQITAEALGHFLEGKNSPLAPYASLILDSPHWSTVIGICTIEQYGCSRLPYGTNWNLWGIGGAAGLRVYKTPEEAIAAITALLARYEERGYDTIEELNGYYVQPASQNWYSVVTKTKAHIESLP